jgi:hypothetical protein
VSHLQFCCNDLRSAYDITFLNPVPGQEDWLAYGTDFETVSSGAPELRYWPVRYCPFCGTRLPPASTLPPRGASPSDPA